MAWTCNLSWCRGSWPSDISGGASLQVVGRDMDTLLAQSLNDNRLDQGPITACQPAPDPRHVNGSAKFFGLPCHVFQTRFQGFVAYGRDAVLWPQPVLGDHVSYPHVGF